jgi:hypothetical protein
MPGWAEFNGDIGEADRALARPVAGRQSAINFFRPGSMARAHAS